MSNQGYFSPHADRGPSFPLPARWSIRITAREKGPVVVKLAIGFDETLELLEKETPIQYDFIASQYTALIAAKNPDACIAAEVWSDLYGEFRKSGGFGGGPKGKLTFHPLGPTFSSAESGF